MYKFTVEGLPGGLTIHGEVEGQKEVFEHVNFWQSLPMTCPVDGTATVLRFKAPGDFRYYSLVSTGFPVYEFKLGQHKKGETLFANEENQWTQWDGEKEIVVWKNGKTIGSVTAPPAPQPTNGNGSKPRPEMPPEVRFQSPPPEADNPFDIAHEVTPPIGRWTKRTAKAAINSGATIDFAGPEDATDFGVAAGAYADKPASVAAYESVKAGVKQPTKEKVMAAWVDYVAGVLMDGEMWGKGEEG